MKHVLAGALAALTLVPMVASATPKAVPCGTHEKNIYDDAKQMFDQGAYTRREWVRAQITYIKAENACGTVSAADACQQEAQVANDLIDLTQKSVDEGGIPSVTLDKVIVEMTSSIAPCSL